LFKIKHSTENLDNYIEALGLLNTMYTDTKNNDDYVVGLIYVTRKKLVKTLKERYEDYRKISTSNFKSDLDDILSEVESNIDKLVDL